MIKLSTAIKNLLKENEQNSLFLYGVLDYKWEKIVGTSISKATKIQKIQNNKIYIKCKNGTWKNELYFQKKQILNKIKKETKNHKIKEIVFI